MRVRVRAVCAVCCVRVSGGKEAVLHLPRLIGPAQAFTNLEMKPRLAMLGGAPETFRHHQHARHLLRSHRLVTCMEVWGHDIHHQATTIARVVNCGLPIKGRRTEHAGVQHALQFEWESLHRVDSLCAAWIAVGQNTVKAQIEKAVDAIDRSHPQLVHHLPQQSVRNE